jgi:plastocyanin domain-containing protein
MKGYGIPAIIGLVVLTVGGAAALHAATPRLAGAHDVQRAAIEVTSRGFVPETVGLVAGVPAELVFTRTTASGCAAVVHIPDLGVDRTELPQGEAVTIRFTPTEPGSYEFLCGMNMLRGTIVVKAG